MDIKAKNTLTIVVCDDESLGRQGLIRQVEALGHVCVGEAANGLEALEVVQRVKPDVILLDIRMPEMDGLECAQHLSSLDTPPAIVFVTAYDEHALAAFKAEAIGYLLKPTALADVEQALTRADKLSTLQLSQVSNNSQGKSNRQHLAARTHRGIELIALDSIYYFVADQKYVTVKHAKGQVLIDETLKELEHEFENQFIRIHRNALISLAYLEGIEVIPSGQYQVKFKHIDDKLLVSRRHLSELKDKMAAL